MSVVFQFHHVGMAVHSIEAAAGALSAVGLQPDPALPDAIDPALRVRLRFLRGGPDQPIIELVEGLDTGSPVARILAKSGPTPYHLCFAVDGLDTAAAHLQAEGYRAISGRVPATAFQGKPVQFFYHAQCGVIELLESAEDASCRTMVHEVHGNAAM